MSVGEIAVLGGIAGGTIFLGLPVGRVRRTRPGLRAFLNATATGILVFLLWDVLAQDADVLDGALKAAVGGGSWARFSGFAVVFGVGLAIGLLSLVGYDRIIARRSARLAGTRPAGPGAMATSEVTALRPGLTTTPARRLALMIAIGIGLHNMSEGLAIGQSASAGDIGLAVLLIVGFALHNATEGFGIVAPLATEPERPGWSYLALLGLIGGGPTFVGTVIGQAFYNQVVYVGFLALAAGSILYVVVQLIGVGLRLGFKELLYVGLLVGLLLGFATDFVVSAAGV